MRSIVARRILDPGCEDTPPYDLLSCGPGDWRRIGGDGPSVGWRQDYAVDPIHSSVSFRIKHMNTSFAWWRFNDVAGRVNLDEEGASLEVQVKTASIDTADARRDEHLRGPDFLDVKRFPAIAFRSRRVAKAGDDTYDVEGTLSLHGVDRPVNVRLERTGARKHPMGWPIAGFAITFSIKRSEYGMKVGLEDLSDEVVLVVNLECMRMKIPTKIAGTYRGGELVALRVRGRMAFLVKPTGTVEPRKRWLWDFPFWLGDQ